MSNRRDDQWIVTLSKDGFMTIAMPAKDADNIEGRALEAGEPLHLYVKQCLGLADPALTAPELVEFHQPRGSYPPFIDQLAPRGFSMLSFSFGRMDGREKILITASVDDEGATVVVVERDVSVWERLFNLKPADLTRKKPARYQFPDADAGSA